MRTVRYSIIKHVLLFLAILLLSACTTTKIKIVDDSTGESIADAFVYIRPMHLLPFPIGKLNILILSDKMEMFLRRIHLSIYMLANTDTD